MRSICQLSLCLVLAAGTAAAQRGGGGMRGGGFGGAVRGGGLGGGFRAGVGYGGIRGGGFGGLRGGYGGFGRGYGGFGRAYVGNYSRFGGGRFFGRGYYSGFYSGFGFWPYFGLSYASYWPYSAYPYWPAYDYYSPYDYGYATYAPSPNVTVIYPQQSAAVGSYDQYGQPVRGAASPLYLIAFKDGTIRAAISYRVEGGTLHYITMDHEDKEAALDTVDRALSTEINRERRVPFSLP